MGARPKRRLSRPGPAGLGSSTCGKKYSANGGARDEGRTFVDEHAA